MSSKLRSPVSLMLRPPWMGSVNAAASVWSLWSATTFFWWFAVVDWAWSNIFGSASLTDMVKNGGHVHRAMLRLDTRSGDVNLGTCPQRRHSTAHVRYTT